MEQKRKEDARLKILEEKQMQGFTGKPAINKKSKKIDRKVNDLFEWKTVLSQKREQELQNKLLKENREMEKMQNTKAINKHSEKIVESKQRMGSRCERVEDRLIRDHQTRMKKY